VTTKGEFYILKQILMIVFLKLVVEIKYFKTENPAPRTHFYNG